MPFQDEQWKPVSGYESFYEISSHGRVRSIRSGKMRKTVLNRYGYPTVMFSVGRKLTTHYVHRLVAKAFVTRGSGEQVNHIDFDHANARADNLEWCTRDENMAHWWNVARQGQWPRNETIESLKGSRNGQSKLCETDVERIRDQARCGRKQRHIARQFGISEQALSAIIHRRTWQHVAA